MLPKGECESLLYDLAHGGHPWSWELWKAQGLEGGAGGFYPFSSSTSPP